MPAKRRKRREKESEESTAPDAQGQDAPGQGEADAQGQDAPGQGEADAQGEGRAEKLRNYLRRIEGKQQQVVEMRIAIVCGFGVALRVLFLNDVPEETLKSTFILIASEALHTGVVSYSNRQSVQYFSLYSLFHYLDFLHLA